ncbi:MAG: TrmH family RNA methyltransferase [Thermoanaerobaculales bacterium]
MKLVQVETLDLPELAPYRTLRRAIDHVREGIFVAEGGRVVDRLLRSDLEVASALLTPAWVERLRPQLESRGDRLAVFVAPVALVEHIVGFHYHQGAMAVGRIRVARPLHESLAIGPRPRLVVALDGLTSAENVGTIVRNCAAFAVDALLVGGATASPWLRRAVRNSMGTVLSLSVHPAPALASALTDLRAGHGFRLVAATPNGSRPLHQASLTRDCCLIFGHEGLGVSPEVLAVCDEAVAIPMPPDVDSLNVASATAVFLYEARRQQAMELRAPQA